MAAECSDGDAIATPCFSAPSVVHGIYGARTCTGLSFGESGEGLEV